jgi:ADP-ribosylation factor related protein 1
MHFQCFEPQWNDGCVATLVGRINLQSSELIFWDLGGQRELMSIWENYYAECHGIIFVIDSTDKERLANVRDAFGKLSAIGSCQHQSNHPCCLLFVEKVINSQEVEGVPVLVLANKQDVDGAMRVEEIKELFNPIAVKLEARDTKVMLCSALNG